ncbi:MAG: deoxyribonuclease IV [Spirochaetota bacterium]
MRHIGFHLSIAGGVYKAFEDMHSLKIDAFQIFLKSSNRWEDKPFPKKDIEKFHGEKLLNPDIRIFAHSAYLINPAADDKVNRTKSLNALVDEMNRAGQLGVEWIVLHPGSHKGTGVDSGIERAVELIDSAFEKADSDVGLLLETTAGQGDCIGARFEDLADIINSSQYQDRFGVCLDTCHVFAAGYDFTTADGMRSMLSDFDRAVGVDRLQLIHLNDSKGEAGSNKDRHEHIGKGEIGADGIKRILREPALSHIPVIMETPKDGEDRYLSDRANLKRVKKLISEE